MILVPADIHAVIDHTGGVAAYRATTGDFTAYDSRRTQPGDEGTAVDEHD